MRYVSSCVFRVVSLGLLLATSCFPQSGLHVDEAATRIQFLNNATFVNVRVENSSRETTTAHVLLDLVDPQGTVQAHGDRDASLPPGATRLKIELSPAFAAQQKPARQTLLWYRIRYTITPAPPGEPPVKPIVGVISVGEATPGIFELHVAVPELVKESGHYVARVRAIHPVTSRPVPEVSLQATLDLDTDNVKPLVTKTALTDRQGFATLEFTLPKEVDTDDIDIKVTGKLADFTAEANGDFRVAHFSNLALNTDKPLYQPGQPLHMRLMAFDFNKKAIKDQPVTLKILDPEETLVYRTEVQTSSFGIASADWQIPENLRLGTYRIQANFGEGRYEEGGASCDVKISRYELPSFSVTAKPDKAFYLPGQNASIEVRGHYLFGEPVRRGHVRLVRETERQWNYREQKWDIQEGEVYEGDTDDQGRYVGKVDLSKDHANLEDSDYLRFRDLTLAAYYTDSSTGRTEQRRFDLRVTKDPVHVYVIQPGGVSKGLPLQFYLSTDYADGTPVSCDVEIRWAPEDQAPKGSSTSIGEAQLLRRIHTNHYGVAKVAGLTLPADADSDGVSVSFRARDRKGDVGLHTESMWFWDRGGIRVETDKTLYKQGESIEVQLTSASPDATVVVEALHEFEVVSSKLVRLKHGHGNVVFDPNEKFQNEISILAYSFGLKPESTYGDNLNAMGLHTVLFPKDRDLKLDVKLVKSTYRPGEDAAADFRVTGPDGAQAKSALGLVVVDKAVEERQRTDSEFGQNRFYSFRNLWWDSSGLAGVTRNDLNKLDLTKPLPDGLELVAEILVQGGGLWPQTFASDPSFTDLRKLFTAEIDSAIEPIRKAVNVRYETDAEYPKTPAALDSYLEAAGLRLQKSQDPWGTPYHARFSVVRESDVLEILTAGPDKTFGTEDDFVATRVDWRYFKRQEETLRKAVNEYHSRTGAFVRDAQILKAELTRLGVDFDSWKDPWGHQYQLSFGVDKNRYTVIVTSAGPDGRFSTAAVPSNDDFSVSTIGIDYFAELREKIDSALAKRFQETHTFPENVEQLQTALEPAAIHWDELKDPWGRRYYATFRQESRFADSVMIESFEKHQQGGDQRTSIVPVTRQINWVSIRSAGEDGKEGTSDDFDVASFSRAVVEQSSDDKSPVPAKNQTVLSGATGAISGAVTDPVGAAVAGADVSAKNNLTAQTFTVKTGADGTYLLRNLPAGFYTAQASYPGFRISAITDVPVRSSNVTKLDLMLRLGQTTETVEVSAGQPALLETTTASLAVAVTATTIGKLPSLTLPLQLATPRLREYFPETLLWQPELVTDDKGHAHLNFPLADNITTWKLSAIASTVDGEVGTAEKEIRAFQPFFVEHDPPRFLTVGDEIALPVVLRNYLDRRLQVNVAIKPSAWFSLLSPTTMKTEIPARDSARGIFRFRADTAAKAGKQEVSAIGADASDAISRSVTVRPNGEEKTDSVSQVFGDAASLDLTVPDAAIAGSVEANLKIYPNLTAHVLESIEAILERPYGCGEQTISSTYPSILLLEYAKGPRYEKSPIVLRARRYAEMGYERLLSYRAPNGGFSYWGRGDGDLALTVYAIRFLNDARQFVAVDDSVVEEALSWVLNQVQPDGHWAAHSWNGDDSSRRSALLTAYIARALANFKAGEDRPVSNQQVAKSMPLAIRRALAYLRPQVDSIDEPYLISSFALAAHAAGDDAAFAAGIARLRKLEHREGNGSYWSLETNTPFYGWGLAGRVETTALALQALTQADRTGDSEALISRGLLFLLQNQDRFGIWYSTQATINVLDAIAALVPANSSSSTLAGTKTAISVDGKPAVSVDLPPSDALTAPIEVDLSKFVPPGKHHIDLQRPVGSARASIQMLIDYYVPWAHASAESGLHHEAKTSDSVRLSVQFDKNSANVGETIQCSVDAERIGYRGYGMLLGEIGLPPGADVDRASLETAMTASGWEVNQFDVLPDRVIVYLWPRAGGTKFSFTFKPRFGIKALTAPSILYDYYNPEAHAIIGPTQFTVQ